MNNLDKNTYFLVAPLPLPIGGVSIHSFRLAHWLLSKGYDCIVFNISRGESRDAEEQLKKLGGDVFTMTHFSEVLRLLGRLLFQRNLVINTHTKNAPVLILALLIRMIKRSSMLVITVHSFRVSSDSKYGSFRARIFAWICGKSDGVIVTNDIIAQSLSGLGCAKELITVSQTYLRPTDLEVRGSLGEGVESFLANKFPIISANAYQLAFYNNEDLYGLDLCIKLTEALKDKGFNVGFVFALPEIGDPQYYNKMLGIIKNKGLENNFFVRREAIGLVSLLALSDFFLRPTNTDGDSISIREALDVGVPVIASDCVQRPPGVILFKNRDFNDLLEKVLSLDSLSCGTAIGRRTIDFGPDVPHYISSLSDIEGRVI